MPPFGRIEALGEEAAGTRGAFERGVQAPDDIAPTVCKHELEPVCKHELAGDGRAG